MSFNPDALDRYITGNYGEDQFQDEPECPLPQHETTYLGTDEGVEVHQCRGCGDLFDTPQTKEDS